MNKRTYILLLTCLCCCFNAFASRKTDSMYSVASVYFNKGDYANNMKLMSAILKTAEQSGDCTDITYAMIKMGGANYFLQQKGEFMKWMFRAKAKARECHNDSLNCIITRQIGTVYYELKKFDSALIYLRESEKLLKRKGYWRDESAVHAVLGEMYLKHLKDTAGARYYYMNSLLFAKYSKDSTNVAFAHIHMGGYLVLTGHAAAGLKHLDTALEYYSNAKSAEGVMFATHERAWALSTMDSRAKVVYDIMVRLKDMRDSVFGKETAIRTAEYRTLYETEKKEKENLTLAKDNAVKELQISKEVRNKRILTVIFISGIIIIVLLFFFIYNRYKLKQEAELERKLVQQQKLRFKAVLEAEEKERVRIARELHDSLGQMLSAAKMNMSAMDSYNEEDAKLMGNAKKLVDDSVKEVRNISHNLMPASLMDKGIVTALNELASKINDTGLMHIDLVISSSEERLDTSVEIAIYRIVQEVVNNMIKHSKANTVEILLDYDSEKIYLSIKDNGIGFDTATIEQSSGIGWKNIFSRVYMMNGDVQIDSQPGRGTLVNIEFAK